MTASNPLADAIRAAMASSSLSRYALSQQTGVSQPVLGRFASGERDLTLETASKLLPALGLELVTRSAGRRRAAAPAEAPPPSPAAKPQRRKPQPSPQVDIPAIMRTVDPAADRGALVVFRVIRPHAKLAKREFDALVLRLAQEQKLVLHRHDFPSTLSKAELQELVHDGENTYFIGAAFRQS